MMMAKETDTNLCIREQLHPINDKDTAQDYTVKKKNVSQRNTMEKHHLKMIFIICCIILCPESIESASVPDSSSQPSVALPQLQVQQQQQQQPGGENGGLHENEDLSPHSHQQEILTTPRSMTSIPTSAASLPSKSLNSNTNTGLSVETANASTNEGQTTKEESQTKTPTKVDDDTKTNPKILFLIKLLFITYYGSLGALMPYLPVYYKSLGHSGQAIGLLGAVKPLTTFIVAPMWGMISDYYQNPSLILQITFITSLVLQLLLPMRNEVNYLMGLVFVTALFNAPVKSLIDSMVMNKLSTSERGQYGRLRLWGQLGFGLGSSMVGFAMSKSTSTTATEPITAKIVNNVMDATMEAGAPSDQVTKIAALQSMSNLITTTIDKLWSLKGYQLAFLAYGLMSIPAFIAMKSFQRINHDNDVQTIDNEPAQTVQKGEKGNPKILQGLNMLLHNSDALLFFSLVFVVGTTSGIIENFAYVRISEVGGTGKEMGLCRLVSSLCGAPMFWFSGPLTSLLGADRVLVLTLISYIFRFLNYALMKHPLHALPAEGMRGIAFAAFWSTGTVFAHKISPPGMSTTMVSSVRRKSLNLVSWRELHFDTLTSFRLFNNRSSLCS